MRRLVLASLIFGLLLSTAAVDSTTALALGAPPVALTGAASSITATTVTLGGTVNPVNQATTFQFEYGTTALYGQQTAVQAAPAGVAPIAVSAAVTGLLPATTYHFRVTATNPSGTTPGVPDQTFTTAAGPTARTGSATLVTSTSAALAGTVNPQGLASTYAVQYGATTSYGQQTPTQSAGSGVADVPISVTITGLTAATTYHYRVTATAGSLTATGADQIFITPGVAVASTVAVTVNPVGGDSDLSTTVTIAADAAGTPGAEASSIAQALSAQFTNQLASFGICASSQFNNAVGPTPANCPDRSAILGTGSLVTRDQAGVQVTSDQGFIVKTAANQVVFWWHALVPSGASAPGFGQLAGLVSQETGIYGPVVTYDLSALPAGVRLKQLALTYQHSAVTGKAPFAAASCTGGSWIFQARIVYKGGVASELPTMTALCGTAALPPAPAPAKLQLLRATITGRVIDILAPISSRASGIVNLELFAAGQHFRWTAPINSADGRIRNTQVLPAGMANNGGTGILTISYPGNAVTRPQVVRLRAGNGHALLDASRPAIAGGHLHAVGTISTLARGVVRVQLEYYANGRTTTLERNARVANGAWSLDFALTAAQQAQIVARRGSVESYILFTGYFPRRIRGEMIAYQVLGSI